MNDKDRNNVERLIAIKERQIGNMEWHVRTNQPKCEELNLVNQRIRDHKDFLKDLQSLVSPNPSRVEITGPENPEIKIYE